MNAVVSEPLKATRPEIDPRLLRYGLRSWLTHGPLLLMTGGMFALLLWAPWYVVLPVGAIVHHRIGILLHEYIHGIPFRKYSYSLAVLSIFEAVLLSMGSLEFFRVSHLTHHGWLNTFRDPAYVTAQHRGNARWWHAPLYLELPQHLIYLFRKSKTLARPVRWGRIALAVFLSSAAATAWIVSGHVRVVVYLVLLTFWTSLVSSSLRGAVEHHGPPGGEGSTNEYRPLLFLFNMNRHLHHHEEPSCPWYLLEYRTAKPLPSVRAVTHWFDVYVRGRLTLMRPEREGQEPELSAEAAEAVERL